MTGIGKRLAFVCFSNSLGGLELSTLRLSIGIRDRGIPVVVVAPPSSPLEKRAREANVASIPLSPLWKYGDIRAALRLARVLKDNRIDLVILMQSKDIHLASLASMIYPDVKLVFYQQMNSRHNKRDLFHTLMFSRLSLWISLTESMRDDVLSFTRMPAEKVKVIPLGADLREFDPAQYGKTEARAFFGLPHNRHIVGVVGRLDPLKGQEVFLRAIADVVQRRSDVFFLIVGDETAKEEGHKAYLENLCRSLGIEQYGKFLPFTRNVAQLMSALDIFVLPSFSETFGLVVIEAMAMEKPVIATDAGGVPELITNGKTGLLVEPRSVAAIAGAIHRILADEPFRSSLARSARIEALQRFDMRVCTDMLIGNLASV